MEKRWSIRTVCVEDAEQVAAHGAYRPSDATRRDGYVRWVRPRIRARAYIGWFAVADGVVVAGAGAVLLDWGPTRANPGGLMARIANVFTDEAWRRRGIARGLLETAMNRCEALGVREFNLGATMDARPLYEALGFETYPAEMRRRVP